MCNPKLPRIWPFCSFVGWEGEGITWMFHKNGWNVRNSSCISLLRKYFPVLCQSALAWVLAIWWIWILSDSVLPSGAPRRSGAAWGCFLRPGWRCRCDRYQSHRLSAAVWCQLGSPRYTTSAQCPQPGSPPISSERTCALCCKQKLHVWGLIKCAYLLDFKSVETTFRIQ